MTTLDQRVRAPFGSFSIAERRIATRTTFCRVRYFHYLRQNFGVATSINPSTISDVFQVREGTIQESEIQSATVSKSINSPSGRFNLTLFPSQNWKGVLSPGDWVAIYFYSSIEDLRRNESNNLKNLVMLGNIDRVARTKVKNEDTDKIELRFQVSGRNFGKAFEETEIWYDPHATNEFLVDAALRQAGLSLLGSPDQLVSKIFDIFLGPGANIQTATVDGAGGSGSSSQNVRTSPLKQWRISSNLMNFFGLTGAANALDSGTPLVYDFVQNLIQKNLPGIKTRAMLNVDSSQSVWDYMSQNSNVQINELFLEEVRNQNGEARPSLVLRPRPLQSLFFEQQFGGNSIYQDALNGAFKKFQDLARESFVEISQAEIRYEDMGKDDHDRLNMFYIGWRDQLNYMISRAADLNPSGVGVGNPFFQRDSIQRHGLKKYDQILEFVETRQESKVKPILDLLKGFIVQLYDLHSFNALYESGTIECSGVLEAELGKVLKIKSQDESQTAPDKLFYIEGYEHKWTFPSTWTTVFTLTHGQYQNTGDENIFIDLRPGDFGREDSEILRTYIAKTQTERPG